MVPPGAGELGGDRGGGLRQQAKEQQQEFQQGAPDPTQAQVQQIEQGGIGAHAGQHARFKIGRERNRRGL
jgi:hypothetical protein